VLPSGKTNVLAIDLGVPNDWRLEEALSAARCKRAVDQASRRRCGSAGTTAGRPCAASSSGSAPGEGHQPVQKVHKVGFFHGLAVVVTIATGAPAGALFGGARRMARGRAGQAVPRRRGPTRSANRFAARGHDAETLPFGLKPFGAPREGLKLLDVDAPPRAPASRPCRDRAERQDDAALRAKLRLPPAATQACASGRRRAVRAGRRGL
jgi:diacylglycerol kinase (ATP)